jgi:diguanylate cyclase (GGDEF)-like protein/PAS domain S-box-containing protein
MDEMSNDASQDDLSALHQRIAELEQERDAWRIIADRIADWDYWLAPDGTLRYVSPACERITGYRPDEFQATPGLLERIIHPDDRDRFMLHLADKQRQQPHELSFRIITRSGEVRWIGHVCQPVFSATGEWLGQRASNRDMTERKQAEKALYEREQFIQQVANTTPGIIYVYDVIQRQNIYSNHRITDLLGYSVEEVQTMGAAFMTTLLHPDDRESYINHLATQAQVWDNDLLTIEYRARHRDGSWRWLISRETVFARTATGQVRQILGVAYDITERKQAEAALRESEERYLRAITAGKVGVWDWDLTTNKMYLAPNLKAMLGYTDHEIHNHLDNWGRFVHPDDRQLVMDAAAAYLRGETSVFEVEHRMVHKDGSVRWMVARGSVSRDVDGHPVRMSGTDTDITDRKQAEAALHESRTLLQAIMDNAPLVIVVKDHDGRYIMGNPRAAANLGMKPEDMIGKTEYAWFPPVYVDAFRASDRQVFATGQTATVEDTVLLGDMRTTYLAVKFPLTNAQGEMHAVGIIAMDITAHKQAEAALRESQAHLQALFDNAAVGIFQLTRDGHWLDINQRGQQMFGYTREELIHLSYLDLIHPDDRERTRQHFHTWRWDEQRSYRTERRYLRKDGSVFWGDLSVTGLTDDAGHVETILCVLVNITRSKLAEAALQQTNQRLQQQAIRDPLTGLYNRRYLDETLPREIRRAARQRQPVGVMMLDIDHFKAVNDRYGHAAGDTMLRTLGAFLSTHTRGEDIACRYGGEEFTLVLPGASLDDTRQRAEDIRAGVQRLEVDHAGQRLAPVTVSLGVAVVANEWGTAELLIRAADQALYQAKRAGRNRVVVAGRAVDDWEEL